MVYLIGLMTNNIIYSLFDLFLTSVPFFYIKKSSVLDDYDTITTLF